MKDHGNYPPTSSRVFCRFHVNNHDIAIAMRHACERGWSPYSHGSENGPEDRLVRINYYKTEIFKYEFQYIFFLWSMTHQPGAYETKHGSAQLNQNGAMQTTSLQSNNCLFTLCPYFQSSLVLFASIPSFGQAVIRMFNCLSIDKEEITVSFPR